MKKIRILCTAAVMLLSSFAFATDSDQVNARVKHAFVNDFSTATAVTWEKISDFYFATFTLNDLEVNAAYNEQGELVGTSRSIESSQLPVTVAVAVAQKYDGYTTSKRALELSFEGQTSYYLSVSNDSKALRIKCSTSGLIEVQRKIKKKHN